MPSPPDNDSENSHLDEVGITAEELVAIKKDFEAKSASYQNDAQYVTNMLLKISGAHSVRYRIKDSEHLVEKIIRKKQENKKRNITLETYEKELTDLAGIRVLHLFKGDWQSVHDYITKTWKLKEKPTAYYRQGDSAKVLEMYTKQSCKVKQHPAGYRSVHYVIELSPTQTKRYIEIQVRTIFEEGWSEVDHKIRYPNFSNNPLTNSLLMILNRLAGSADELSDFMQEFNSYILTSEQEYKQLKAEKDEKIKQLEAIIDNGKLSNEEKTTLQGIAKSIQQPTNPLLDLAEPRYKAALTAVGSSPRFAGGGSGILDYVSKFSEKYDHFFKDIERNDNIIKSAQVGANILKQAEKYDKLFKQIEKAEKLEKLTKIAGQSSVALPTTISTDTPTNPKASDENSTGTTAASE